MRRASICASPPATPGALKRALTQRHNFVVDAPKAISRMGYKDDLHATEARIGRDRSDLQSPTWARVLAGEYRALGESDIAILYLLCRRLERRNIATRQFIESGAAPRTEIRLSACPS